MHITSTYKIPRTLVSSHGPPASGPGSCHLRANEVPWVPFLEGLPFHLKICELEIQRTCSPRTQHTMDIAWLPCSPVAFTSDHSYSFKRMTFNSSPDLVLSSDGGSILEPSQHSEILPVCL